MSTISVVTQDLNELENQINTLRERISDLERADEQRINNAWSKLDETLTKLEKKYDQKPETEPTSFLGRLWKMVDFFSSLKKASFAEEQFNLNMQFQRFISRIHLEHMREQGPLQRQLHDELDTLIGTAHFLMKQKIINRDAEVIGRINTPGNDPVKTQALTKQWLAEMNALREQGLEMEELRKIIESQNLTIQISEQAKTEKKIGRADQDSAVPVDTTFAEDILAKLVKSKPPSLQLNLTDENGNSHSIGIFKDDNGIWIHDPTRFTICFQLDGNTVSDKIKESFSQFFNEYHQELYAKFTQGNVVHVKENAELIPEVRSLGAGASRRATPMTVLQGATPKASISASPSVQPTPDLSTTPTPPTADKDSPHSPRKK